MDYKRKAKDEDLRNSENKEKLKLLEQELSDCRKENTKLLTYVNEISEKAENDRKYRSELEKIKLNLLSVRNNEVEKLNSMFESIFQSEDSKNHRTPVSRQYRHRNV